MATQKKTEWWDDDDEVGATYVARATQGPLTQSQAAASNTWAGVGQTLSQALYGTKPATPTTTSSSKPKPKPEAQPAAPQPIYSFTPDRPTQGPQQRPVQGPQPRPETQPNSWDAVINRLRPSLTPDRAQTTAPRQFAPTPLYQQPVSGSGSIGTDDPGFRSEGSIGGSDAGRLAAANDAARRQAVGFVDYAEGKGPPPQPAYVPTQNTYDRPEKYGWDDMWAENLHALGEGTADRIRQDWSDTWNAGKGNFFSVTEQASQMEDQRNVARDNNEEVMQRAMQLRQTYWDQQQATRMTLSGMPIPEAEMNINTLSLQPFIAAAEQELGRTLFVPENTGPLSQAESVAQGVMQNFGQIPVAGVVNSATGNAIQTAAEFLSVGPRALLQTPVQTGGFGERDTWQEFMGLTPPRLLTEMSEDEEFVTVGELAGSALEALIDPEKWWSNPSNWSWQRNPMTILQQVATDNVRRTLDTVYPLVPEVGSYYNPVDPDYLKNRELKGWATTILDLSGSRAHADYISTVLNKPERIAQLRAERDAAMAASQNMALPEDVRENQALIAAQAHLKAEMLANADAQTLAYTFVKPVQDAVLSTVLDVSVWYDVLRMLKPGGLQLPSFSPKDRRLNRTIDALNMSEEAVRQKVATVIDKADSKSFYYNTFIEGPLARTEYEKTQARTFLPHLFQGVTDRSDVATILQYMVKNALDFVEQGIPVDLLKSKNLRELASPATGKLEFPVLQMMRDDFNQLYSSLKSLDGQFANLPALADPKATFKDVINNLSDAIEMQSAHRNGVLSIERPVPLGTTEARLTPVMDAKGNKLFVTEYVNKDGKVLARYPAPAEALGRREVDLAQKFIKDGRYKDTNWGVFMTDFVRSRFSMNVLTLWPPSWMNNTVGALTTGFTTASNTLRPVGEITRKAANAFPAMPYEYLDLQTGGVMPKNALAKLWQQLKTVRSGHTELKLGPNNTIGFGERALQAKAWDAGSNELMGIVTDAEWRQVVEPIFQNINLDPAVSNTFRSSLERLARDWDMDSFGNDMLAYAQGRLKRLDIAGVSKHYELALTPDMQKALDNLATSAQSPQELATGIQRVIDAEVERLGNVAGYDSASATNPVSIQGTIAEALSEVEKAVEGLARNGITVGEDVVSIHQGIASVQDHARRIYTMAVQAKMPQAMQEFRNYWEAVNLKFKDIEYSLSRLAREARLRKDPGLWRDFYQAKLSYYKEGGEYAVQVGEQALARILGYNEVQLPPTARLASQGTTTAVQQTVAPVMQAVEQAAPDLDALRIQFEDEVAQQITPLNNRLREIVTQLEAMQQAPPAPTGSGVSRITAQDIQESWQYLVEEVGDRLPSFEQMTERLRQGKNALSNRQLEAIGKDYVGGVQITGHEAMDNLVRQWEQLRNAGNQAPAAAPAAPVVDTTLRQALEAEARQLMEQVARLQPEIEQRVLDAMRAAQQQPAPGSLTPVTDPQLQRRGIAYIDESDPVNPVYLTADEAATYQPQQHVAAQLSDLPPTDPLLDTPWAAAEEVVGGPKTFPDISQAPTTQFRDRRYVYAHRNEVYQWFRDAERQYWSAYMDVAQQAGDLRAMDIMLQVESDISRIKTEVNAKVARAREIYLETRGAAGSTEWEAANAIFYQMTADAYYEQGLTIHAKIKAAAAYVLNAPEPVTYRHAQYGEVTVLGHRENQVALQLQGGQIVTVAEDVVPLPVLTAAQKRMEQIRAASKNPGATVQVAGIPEAWAKEVDQRVTQYYDDLTTSRQNLYTAMPTTTDATADTILLLSGLREKAQTLADNLFKQTPAQLTPQQGAAFLDTVTAVKRKFRSWAEAASKHGDDVARLQMVGRGRRYRVDEWLAFAFPFPAWTTRTMKNLSERIASQPMVRHALDIEGALFEYLNGDEEKRYVDVEIGGRTHRVYASLSKYWLNPNDWNADPSYWEQERMEGPLGPLYQVERAIGSRAYPWFGAIDNIIRKQTGQETVPVPGGAPYSLPIPTLLWRGAMAAGGINTARLSADLPVAGFQSLFGDRDINDFSRSLAILTNRGEITGAEAGYAAGVLDNVRTGKPIPPGMTQAQWDAGYKLADEIIKGMGGRGLFASLSSSLLLGTTVVPQQEGAAEFAAAQDQYFNVAYPGNQAGGVMAQSAIMEANPGIPVYWVRYNLKDPKDENPAVQARYSEYQAKIDGIYDRMNDAVTSYIMNPVGPGANAKALDAVKAPFYAEAKPLEQQARKLPADSAERKQLQSQIADIYNRMNDAVLAQTKDLPKLTAGTGRVASYKGVSDTKAPFWDEINAVKEQYKDILDEREWAPRDVTKMNPYERAVYELEQTLRYDGKAPDHPAEDATPEEQVAAWAAIDAWERARLDYIERTIENINVSYEGPGDPPADLWVRELEKLTTGEYASELIRKYQTIKNADRVERQWSPYGTFAREMDDVMYQQRAENVRERMGDAAVRTFQIYQRVKDENKEQYREEHPEVTVALTAAYNPESYDQAIQMFGSDVWTKYKSYKNAKGALTYPEGGTDEQVDAYYDKLAAIQKQYPGIVEAEFWIDGRHRWWYGAGEENYRSTEPGPREGAMGADYELAKQLFGPDIFKTVQAFPSGGTKKQIAQFYDKHPEYAAYSAWRKQYTDLTEMTLADLPGLNLSQLPAQQTQVPASTPPWWTKFATQGEVSRPLNDPRERINETPAMKQERLAADAAFKQAKAAEAAKVKAIQTQGRAAVVDASGWEDDEFSRRYGRRSGSRRRYYGGRRGRGGGGRRSGGGGGYGFEVPGVNPALWAQAERQVTPLNPVGSDINPHLWASVLERLRRPGR